jgi:8-amino-7-oxononanoate synthase
VSAGQAAPRDTWPGIVAGQLAALRAQGRWRSPRSFDALGPEGLLVGGRSVVSFASNDYLGLSAHPAVVAAATAALERWGTGSGASRLVTGSRPVHHELEEALADWKGTEAAVCFPTGFAANLGVLVALAGAGTRILSDEHNHASIVDGCRLARADVAVYRHGDVEHLATLLGASDRPTLVVTDSVFSMDGDLAPLPAILDLCARTGALVVLDEAHAVLGPEVDPAAVEAGAVVRVGTLSKMLGSLGGFVAARREVVELLVNCARPYIFTTAPSPADTAGALAALGVVRSPEGDGLRTRLRALVDRIAPGHPAPIVPFVMGSEERALEASAALLAEGLWVPAIRPPTVPAGTSRLRVTLSAAHSEDQVDALSRALAATGAVHPAAA